MIFQDWELPHCIRWSTFCQYMTKSRAKTRWLAPTMLEKIGLDYYLIDCWQGKVFVASELKADNPRSWSILLSNLQQPHSMASDGEILVIDEARANQLRVIKLPKNKNLATNKKYLNLYTKNTQIVKLAGQRPHRVRYDQKQKLFYCLTACDQKLFVLEKQKGQLVEIKQLTLPFLNNFYCRSFTIDSKTDCLFLVAGSDDWSNPHQPLYKPQNSFIYQIKLSHLRGKQPISFTLIKKYPVPAQLANMNDLFFDQKTDRYYLSATPQQLVTCRKLDDLAKEDFIDLFASLNLKGTPYFLTYLEQEKVLVVPEIDQRGKINFFTQEKLN